MNPEIGQHVIIYFRNGVRIEGNVIAWSDQKSVIKSDTGSSTIIIQKTLDDVLFIKISDPKTEYEKLREKPNKEEDDIKAIAELKIELNELERAEVKEKLTSHVADGMREIQYGCPSTISKGLENIFKK